MFIQLKYTGPKLANPRRSAAQRARRQRELAATIEGLLRPQGCQIVRSQAQTLRRRVEEGEKRQEGDCGWHFVDGTESFEY